MLVSLVFCNNLVNLKFLYCFIIIVINITFAPIVILLLISCMGGKLVFFASGTRTLFVLSNFFEFSIYQMQYAIYVQRHNVSFMHMLFIYSVLVLPLVEQKIFQCIHAHVCNIYKQYSTLLANNVHRVHQIQTTH